MQCHWVFRQKISLAIRNLIFNDENVPKWLEQTCIHSTYSVICDSTQQFVSYARLELNRYVPGWWQ